MTAHKAKKKKDKINRIYHQSPMQTKKSQSEGKRIMPKTRFVSFPLTKQSKKKGNGQEIIQSIPTFKTKKGKKLTHKLKEGFPLSTKVEG